MRSNQETALWSQLPNKSLMENFTFSAMSMPTEKQPSEGIHRKRCSENMQQIHSRTPMPKCVLKKATLFKSHFGKGVFL